MEKIRTTAHWEGDKLVVDLPEGLDRVAGTFEVDITYSSQNPHQLAGEAKAMLLRSAGVMSGLHDIGERFNISLGDNYRFERDDANSR